MMMMMMVVMMMIMMVMMMMRSGRGGNYSQGKVPHGNSYGQILVVANFVLAIKFVQML